MTAGSSTRRDWRATLLFIGCWLIVVLPLVVAAIAATHPRWYPVQDQAQYELRVRDVGGAHPPLIGLAGRIGPWYDPGSHPGPISFWLLAPVYRLLGSSAASLVASVVTLHAIAVGLVLWMARRRAGVPLLAVVTGGLVVLTRFYGPNVFIDPWNPYLPVSWWLVLLFAIWSVLDGDAPMLVVAVVAGTFCAQTHLPYVGLVGGLVAVLLVTLGWSLWSARRRGDRDQFVRFARWGAGAAVFGVVLWIPPVIDQIWGVGNLTRIKDSVSNPTESVSGFRRGPEELLRNLDPTALVSSRDLTDVSEAVGICWPAVLLVVAWVVAAVVSWRCRLRRLTRLHVVIGAALALAAFSSARIYGLLWNYLFLWAWGLSFTMVLATVWTFVTVLRPHLPAGARVALPRVATTVGVAVAVLASVAYGVQNLDAAPAHDEASAELGVVSGELVHALRTEEVPGYGPSGEYIVRWTDPISFGAQGWGLVNELERAGLHGGFDRPFGVGGTKHRVLDPAEATAVAQLVVGDEAIAEWDARPDATRVAQVDLRTPAQRQEQAALVDRVQQELQAAGLTKQAEDWRTNAFTTSIDPNVPPAISAEMRQVLDIPSPVAIYLLPVPPAG